MHVGTLRTYWLLHVPDINHSSRTVPHSLGSGSGRDVPGYAHGGHQPVRYARQALHHHGQGHAAGPKNSGREQILAGHFSTYGLYL
jgi:hypothetical protein